MTKACTTPTTSWFPPHLCTATGKFPPLSKKTSTIAKPVQNWTGFCLRNKAFFDIRGAKLQIFSPFSLATQALWHTTIHVVFQFAKPFPCLRPSQRKLRTTGWQKCKKNFHHKGGSFVLFVVEFVQTFCKPKTAKHLPFPESKNYFARLTATAQATVAPTIGLLPIPIKPIIST